MVCFHEKIQCVILKLLMGNAERLVKFAERELLKQAQDQLVFNR